MRWWAFSVSDSNLYHTTCLHFSACQFKLKSVAQSIRFRNLETASKTTWFRKVYITWCRSNRFPSVFKCYGKNKCCTSFKVHSVCSSGDNQFRASDVTITVIDAVSSYTRPMEPYCFENAPLLTAFSKRCGFIIDLDRRRVNERRNWNRVREKINETASV